MRSDWSDVRQRLARLAALAEAETQLGVELPGEYRAFLLEAGPGRRGARLRALSDASA